MFLVLALAVAQAAEAGMLRELRSVLEDLLHDARQVSDEGTFILDQTFSCGASGGCSRRAFLGPFFPGRVATFMCPGDLAGRVIGAGFSVAGNSQCRCRCPFPPGATFDDVADIARASTTTTTTTTRPTTTTTTTSTPEGQQEFIPDSLFSCGRFGSISQCTRGTLCPGGLPGAAISAFDRNGIRIRDNGANPQCRCRCIIPADREDLLQDFGSARKGGEDYEWQMYDHERQVAEDDTFDCRGGPTNACRNGRICPDGAIGSVVSAGFFSDPGNRAQCLCRCP